MQPTVKFVDEQGPTIKPDNFVKKDDYKEEIKNYATIKLMNDSLDNKIAALDNYYYDKDYIDGQLDCKSNTDHTHTDLTLNTLNDMPIIGKTDFLTTYPFIPTVGWYPFKIMMNLL